GEGAELAVDLEVGAVLVQEGLQGLDTLAALALVQGLGGGEEGGDRGVVDARDGLGRGDLGRGGGGGAGGGGGRGALRREGRADDHGAQHRGAAEALVGEAGRTVAGAAGGAVGV